MTRVLDFASDPHLQGPSDALDEQGKFRWSTDGSSLYLPLESDMTPRYAYLTFDGQLEPSRWVMDEIKDLIPHCHEYPVDCLRLGQRQRGERRIAGAATVRCATESCGACGERYPGR